MDVKHIQGCRKQNREAQRLVYEIMAPKLYRLCKRYLKKEEEIEEVLADAFFTLFTKIEQLKEDLAFEAWARKITVNNCLLQIKKNINFNLYLEDVSYNSQPLADEVTDLEEEDLLNLLQYIPDGCQTIFNLFVIEGYSHKECFLAFVWQASVRGARKAPTSSQWHESRSNTSLSLFV